MKKLKLQLDTLRVESFPTAQTDAAVRGTVAARDGSVHTYGYYEPTCMVQSCQIACRTRYQVTCEVDCWA